MAINVKRKKGSKKPAPAKKKGAPQYRGQDENTASRKARGGPSISKGGGKGNS